MKAQSVSPYRWGFSLKRGRAAKPRNEGADFLGAGIVYITIFAKDGGMEWGGIVNNGRAFPAEAPDGTQLRPSKGMPLVWLISLLLLGPFRGERIRRGAVRSRGQRNLPDVTPGRGRGFY